MNKKPFVENDEQQETVTESVLFRLWSRIKEKKADEKKAETEPPSESEKGPAEPENQEKQALSENDLKDAQPALDEANAVQEPLPEPNQLEKNVPDGEQQPENLEKPTAEEEKPKPPVDASIKLKVTKDNMTASVVISPPENGGADITQEMIQQCLKEKGVLEEFISPNIKMLCALKLYNKSAIVAKGIPCVNGKNGSIEELFKREHNISLETDENGLVNYKNLNKLCIVKKDTVICKIIQPEPPTNGKDLFGKEVLGKAGVPAKISIGKNTALSVDGTTLIATCDGNLHYGKDSFIVEDVLHIPADVDNAIGNIEFCGDIIIDGGVREGFSVQSDKSITIKGAVEGAFINAKGNITLNKGMNGMNRGVLRAGGDVRCKFLENCMVVAGGSILTECIMNSRVTAENQILVETGKGTIVGGTCTARNLIKARYIGSPAYVATTIVLGASPEIVAQKNQIMKQIEELKKEVDNLDRNCSYLERAAKKAPLSTARADQLTQMKKQRMMSSVQISINTKQLIDLDELIESLDSCKLSCFQIYPPVKILMANESLQVKEKESHRLYFYENGEIKVGSI